MLKRTVSWDTQTCRDQREEPERYLKRSKEETKETGDSGWRFLKAQ